MSALSVAASSTRRRRLALDRPWVPPAVLVGVQVLFAAFVSPQRDFPVLDDWAYAQVVQSILRGQPHLSEFQAAPLIFHAYWGALWCAVFGFSFTVLNVANMTMNVLGSLALYGLLRELRFAWALAWAGTLTWVLNPLTIVLAYSFQTNLTFIAVFVAALWAFVAATRRPHGLPLMLLGGACSAAAVLTRQIGVAAPLAAALVWVWRLGPRRALPGVAAALIPPALAYALFTRWADAQGGLPWASTQYTPGAVLAYWATPLAAPAQGIRVMLALGYLAFFLLPLFALLASALWRRWRAAPRGMAAGPRGAAPAPAPRVRGVLYGGLAVLVAGVFGAFYATIGGSFNSGADLMQVHGYWATLTGEDLKLPLFPPLFWSILTALVAALAGVLVILLWRALGAVIRPAPAPRDPGLVILTLAMLGVFALTFVSAIYHDEYVHPLLVGLIVFLLAQVRGRSWALAPAAAALFFLAAFSLLSLREYYNWQATAWRAGRVLLAAGVPPSHISGGIEWNYWYLWEAAVREAKAAGQPLSYHVHQHLLTPDYVLSFVPQPRTIVDSPRPDIPPAAYQVCAQFPYGRPLSATPGAVYILALHGCPAGLTAGTIDDRR